MNLLQCGNCRRQSVALGRKLPRPRPAGTAATPPTTDSKAHSQRARFGPEPNYDATIRIDHRIGDLLFEQGSKGVFRLLIVILIERATTVIDPVAATAAPAL